jgi:hypothetical protein
VSVAAPLYRFDGKNAQAQRVARQRGAQLVTRVSRETRKAIRAVVVRAIDEGIPVVDATRLIRGLVGLNAPQAAAAMAYREELVASGLSRRSVEAAMDRYVTKKIAERAEMIARTEVMDGLNGGQLEGWRQAREEGWLGKGATKEWIYTPVESCDACEALDGVAVPLDAQFHSAIRGVKVNGPTLHPRCRCTLAVNP